MQQNNAFVKSNVTGNITGVILIVILQVLIIMLQVSLSIASFITYNAVCYWIIIIRRYV